ncbi:hypothetical protein D0865_05974 [Hortaea werneckii]|uniref:Uncharacterized protein n=1 Tax=Hortaea werneckii TaxID=91943 RepID=A0A3M7CKC6_HORWE|nr:hypothetical protein D0865_05974 [Hortaea werneckii]
MTDELPSSSQDSYYEAHRIPYSSQENLPPSSSQTLPSSPPPRTSSSPRRSRSKPKALPTVTPKRFRKFFTPRSTLSGKDGTAKRQSKAGRQLRDITQSGTNLRPKNANPLDDLSGHLLADGARPAKRRKTSIDISSSPPLSSPLKHVQPAATHLPHCDDLPSSPILPPLNDDALDHDIDEDLVDRLDDLKPFPTPIRRLRPAGPARRILERSFGGFNALSQAHCRGVDHGADWRSEIANFVSTPSDVHSFRGQTGVPFCTTSCNTNSLIAIGDEEGTVRLIDSSPASNEFDKSHVKWRVHHNAIMDLAFSSNDYRLATGSGDQTARVVDMATQQTLCILSSHTSSVKQIRFNPSDSSASLLTTSSRDGTVQVWDLRCSERGSVMDLRAGQRRGLNADGRLDEPSVRFSRDTIRVGPAHRNARGSTTRSPAVLNSEDVPVSITAIEHLPHGREHLLLTASELSASIKVWDLRTTASSSRSGRDPVPFSSTAVPDVHKKTRNFGISSLALSGDSSRIYTLCKDATVYAYSSNHLALGSAPEMNLPLRGARRGAVRESKQGLGPLYGFRHPALRTGTFYLKAAVRPAKNDQTEMLAVGNTDGAPVLFPTDERHFARRAQRHPDDEEEGDDEAALPSLSSSIARSKAAAKAKATNLPVHQNGTALVRGHKANKEVTGLSWTYDGDLVSISDDFTARCWREDGEKARWLRGCGEGGGLRWGHGWADMDEGWDDEDC